MRGSIVRIFFPGAEVPEWLEKVEPHGPDSKLGSFTFSAVCCVWTKGGEFHVRALMGEAAGAVMTIRDAGGVTISGQSPQGGPGHVQFHMVPILTWVELILGFAGFMSWWWWWWWW